MKEYLYASQTFETVLFLLAMTHMVFAAELTMLFRIKVWNTWSKNRTIWLNPGCTTIIVSYFAPPPPTLNCEAKDYICLPVPRLDRVWGIVGACLVMYELNRVFAAPRDEFITLSQMEIKSFSHQ